MAFKNRLEPKESAEMTINELLQEVVKERPQLLAGLSEKRVTAIVRAVFACVGKVIDATQAGNVKIGGFGGFHVRQVEREAGGGKVTRKVVVFRAAQPKKKGAV
jgi:nucleoid DNA-binding protein